MLLSGAVRPLPWERVQLLSVLFVYSYIIFAFQKQRQCRNLEFVTPQDLRNDFITFWLATAFECTGTRFYFVSELEVSDGRFGKSLGYHEWKAWMLISSFQQQNPFHRKNTMSSFIFFIMWFLKVAKTFTGLPPSPVRFQVAWLPGTHSLCCFRTPRCLFVRHKPQDKNPPLSGTFISWGKRKKKKTFFSLFVDLGQMSFLPWQKWNEW